MSVTIDLYKYRHRANIIDKSSLVEDRLILTGEFRDAVNVVNPQLVITTDGTTVTTARILNKNYVYIEDLKRFYFVTNIEMTRKNLVTISLHVDVLSSFRLIINECSGYVSRNEYNYNFALPDERRILSNRYRQSTYNVTATPSNISLVNTIFDHNIGGNTGHNFVMCYVNQTKTQQSFNYKALGYVRSVVNSNDQVMNYYNMNVTVAGVLSARGVSDVLFEVMNNNALASFIGSIVAYPFNIDDVIDLSEIQSEDLIIDTELINNISGTARTIKLLPSSISPEIVIADFTLTSPSLDDFNKFDPYADYEIYLPFYGFYKINFNVYKDHRLLVYYTCNFQNNSATVYLCDYTNGTRNIIFSSPCRLGIEIGTTTTNTREVNNARIQNDFSTNLAILSTFIGGLVTVAGVATANPLVVAGGVSMAGVSGVKAIGQHEINEQKNIKTGNVQFGSDSTALLSTFNVYIRLTYPEIQYPLNNSFLHENGGVCNQYYARLNTLRGYTEVIDPHFEFDSLTSGADTYVPTTEEINEIIDLLKNGVYFAPQT